LYLPRKWIEDDEFEDRRQQCDVAENIGFRTKPEIAIDLVSRARQASVPHACVGADSGYGKYLSFRTQLREWNEPYILGIRPKTLPVIPESTPI